MTWLGSIGLQIRMVVEVPKPKVKAAYKPKSIYLWTVADVQKWFKRHCADYCHQYNHLFQAHEVTGRTLLRINDNALMRLGITNATHRGAICREICKLKLKTDIVEIWDLQHNVKRNGFNSDLIQI